MTDVPAASPTGEAVTTRPVQHGEVAATALAPSPRIAAGVTSGRRAHTLRYRALLSGLPRARPVADVMAWRACPESEHRVNVPFARSEQSVNVNEAPSWRVHCSLDTDERPWTRSGFPTKFSMACASSWSRPTAKTAP